MRAHDPPVPITKNIHVYPDNGLTKTQQSGKNNFIIFYR